MMYTDPPEIEILVNMVVALAFSVARKGNGDRVSADFFAGGEGTHLVVPRA